VTPAILVNIDVDDLDRAIAFYTALLELKVGRRFGSFGVELVGGSAPLYLLVKAAGTAVSPASSERRRYGRHWTPVHLDFAVPHLEKAVAAALAAGATQDEPPETHRWGSIAHMADPFGHGFCLIEFTGRGYDEVATG
jgi:catechol 2,3-dioxygenase-like lactoylglutathione lyase family enzyme